MENKQTNSSSIISLVFGILSILIPFIGLILGVIGFIFSRKARKEIIKTNEGGSGIATSGFACSIAGILIQIFVILGFIGFTFLSFTSISQI